MLANSKPLSLFKEGFRNRISIASLMWRDITLLNIHISTVADEVRLVRTKYSTSTVFNIYYALSQEIFYYFKNHVSRAGKQYF